ncbi:hypothetical protein BSKO_11741 [Bryopsis sp. KO-2023]|nr:hypothetical protein BSKO_11741 [Bryopsis sp. KO-2023]
MRTAIPTAVSGHFSVSAQSCAKVRSHRSFVSGKRGCVARATRDVRDVGRSSFLRLAFLSSVGVLGSGSPLTAQAAQKSIEQVLDNPKWPKDFPLKPDDFGRYDESPDTFFYDSPRLVTHIDDGAINALTKYYSEVFPESGKDDVAILDICSSWISHYPKGYKAGKITGLGMNQEELKRNSVLTDFDVRDLNSNPELPYEDNTFDVITNCVSVDYLTKPMEIFAEMHRCLKPGGLAAMSFSNRCFPTKAIAVWTSTGDPEHVWIVGSYFHYSVPGGFEDPKCKDISAPKNFLGIGGGDPMYVVYARKKA